tara:strand:+ start:2993 stop:3904 length:912 start_codon:yes stop_codon:yes gene_type:complete
MAKTYAAARGTQGIAPGMIVPFTKECQSQTQLDDRVPGGYLRCDGTVYQAADYPDLARVLGVGASGGSGIPACRFPPGIAGTSLLNPTLDPDGNFTGGTFAVPNLGAKSLMPSNIAGTQFMGDLAMAGGSIVERAGIGYQASMQPTASSTYTGYVRVEEYEGNASGTPILTLSKTTVDDSTINITNCAAHSHELLMNQTEVRNVGTDQDYGGYMWKGPTISRDKIRKHNELDTGTVIDIATGDATHNHTLGGQQATNNIKFKQPRIDISFAGSGATCSVTADAREHLNHVTTPYMILEYIIKY